MSKQEEIYRLKALGLTERAIARALKCSRNTIKKYLSGEQNLAQLAPVPAWVLDLDWDSIHSEFLGGVPLNVLWEEHAEDGKIPVQYPGFWKQFVKKYPNTKEATMIRQFSPGERVEVDYCDGIDILNASTGEVISTQLFVGVLCFSRYVFAEFTLSQKSCDFLSSHVRMFEAFGGVPATVTPDNLKSSVSKVHRYDPEKNPAYARLAAHYSIAVTPARVRAPKDKPIVERTIQIFQKWFYFRVRHRTFTSLVELNQCLQEHLEIFHQKQHRVLRRTRQEMFIEEKKHLSALPETSYEVAIHHRATLGLDCHLQFDKSYYSAPWTLRSKKLDVWASDRTVEIWHEGERVALHARNYQHGRFRTNKKHYPPQHQAPRNVIIIGPTGVGKTFLVTAIGSHACREGYTVTFMGMNMFIEETALRRATGTFLKLRERLIKTDLLILDDLGIKPLPPTAIQDLYDVLEERYQSKSTLITSQLPLENWKEVIDDSVALEAIMDRLIHGATKIEMKGESYRKKRGSKQVLDTP